MYKPMLPFICCLFLVTRLLATHNLSGEIIYQKTGGLGVTVSVITYTNAAFVSADRDSLTVAWGDGNYTRVARVNGSGEIITGDIKKNIYTSDHTYAAEGIYRIAMTDPNRSAGIINLNPPASDNIPFHLEAMVRLLPDAASSLHSPVFLNLPIDAAYLQQTFQHVPNGFDADGDSLAYALAMPLQDADTVVPNYFWPYHVLSGPQNQIFLDSLIGKFTWNAPQVAGLYCICVVVRAYRNGILVEETRRDMVIEVEPAANNPPFLSLLPDLPETEIMEVTVGQTLQIQLLAQDPDAGQALTYTASGGLFEDFFQQKAVFSAASASAVFSWTAQNEHLREQPHQIVFKVQDDFEAEGLATFRVVRFRVRAVSGVSGVENGSLKLHIYPNPNTGAFHAELPAGAPNGAKLQVIDYFGQLVRVQSAPTGQTRHALELSDLPAGLYFLQVVAAGKVLAAEKFVQL